MALYRGQAFPEMHTLHVVLYKPCMLLPSQFTHAGVDCDSGVHGRGGTTGAVQLLELNNRAT